ncbi:hypothetical protein HMPREF0762_00714 [Slackia exigua ATCC 700122]|uniref:Uncharacterized protein n=1 Tax=Slackia exigua (strain ATCC 700122 / DSM 15923 / CIP 105133 / JCM 11022 / KCTC 5966 / S-7) TaxID=649764 RepID=D0WFW4_SLAES|nr:hypothetical protein HMPREF0762_00714 [Slackia exigua ATCC 700122]
MRSARHEIRARRSSARSVREKDHPTIHRHGIRARRSSMRFKPDAEHASYQVKSCRNHWMRN